MDHSVPRHDVNFNVFVVALMAGSTAVIRLLNSGVIDVAIGEEVPLRSAIKLASRTVAGFGRLAAAIIPSVKRWTLAPNENLT